METPGSVYDGTPADDKVADDKPTGEVDSESTDEVKTGATDVELSSKDVDDKTGSDDTDDTAKKDDVPPASIDETKVPLAALQEQRDKRQSAERERDELKTKLDESVKPTDPTSVFDDEDKFRNELKRDFNDELNNQRYNQSQFFVEKEIGKEAVATKFEAFKVLAAANPALSQQMANAISPYHEMVTIVDQHGELAKMQDLPAYRATLKAELLAEIKADSEKDETDKTNLRDSIPDSLAGEGSVGKRTSADSFNPKTAKEQYG